MPREPKLDFWTAQAIREDAFDRDVSLKQLAEENGVTVGAIYGILKGESYREGHEPEKFAQWKQRHGYKGTRRLPRRKNDPNVPTKRLKYDPNYQIAADGTIYYLGKSVKPRINEKGHPVIELGGKEISLAYVVADHFLKGRKPDHYVAHKDGDKLNCRVDNLIWKKRRFVPTRGVKGEANSHAIMTEEQVREIRQFLDLGFSIKEIAENYGYGYAMVYKAAKGLTWKHVT